MNLDMSEDWDEFDNDNEESMSQFDLTSTQSLLEIPNSIPNPLHISIPDPVSVSIPLPWIRKSQTSNEIESPERISTEVCREMNN
jgi:hypothetical protein